MGGVVRIWLRTADTASRSDSNSARQTAAEQSAAAMDKTEQGSDLHL